MSDNYDPGGWAQYYKEKYAATLERERVLLDHISKIAGALMIGVEDGEYYIPAEPEPIICGASIVDACKAFKEFGDKMALQDGHRIAALEAQLETMQRELAEARKLAQWTPITPETMPKKSGDDFYVAILTDSHMSATNRLSPYDNQLSSRAAFSLRSSASDRYRVVSGWYLNTMPQLYTHFRPITPPQEAPRG